MNPPKFLFMETNRGCNLRCQHCAFWTYDDDQSANYLTDAQRESVIQEFAAMGGQTVVTCGGEPMLDRPRYFFLTDAARRAGLRCFSVVNGTKIRNAAEADEMLEHGPSEVTVSVNSHVEADHDVTRGVRGSWKMAIGALRLMLAARAKMELPAKIYAMAVIHEGNYRTLDAFFDFMLNDVGVDKLKLNIVQPSFGVASHDEFFSDGIVKDHAAFRAVVEACNAKYGLGIDPKWLDVVCGYFADVNRNGKALMGWSAYENGKCGTKDVICNSCERNIMVNAFGRARLCFSPDFPSVRLRGGDLKVFWENAGWRDDMRKCTRYCGISHSVRAQPATARAA